MFFQYFQLMETMAEKHDRCTGTANTMELSRQTKNCKSNVRNDYSFADSAFRRVEQISFYC